MDCSIVYYISYKTGYIQRSLTKKFRTMSNITVKSGYAAVSPQDLCDKFRRAMKESQLVIVVGGLSAPGDSSVMDVLSGYFTRERLEVGSSKRVVNTDGDDGYLISTGEKYVLVLPDDPESCERMFGAELLKNIRTANPPGEAAAEPVVNHTVVFAPEPDDSTAERLKTKHRASLPVILAISLAAAVCAAAGVWVWLALGSR